MGNSNDRPGESGNNTDLSNVMAEEKENRFARNPCGSAFETICPGYHAETTLSLTFSIDSMDRQQTSEQVLVANHLKWYLYIKQQMSGNESHLEAFVSSEDLNKYPMTYDVEFTLEAKDAHDRITTPVVKRSYDYPLFGRFGQELIKCDTLQYYRDKYEVGGKVTMTAKLIVSMPTCFNFNVSNSFSDVTINVGDVAFPFNKVVLAVHSSYFNAMFFGSFKESNEDEVTLEDVEPSDFVSLINVVFVRTFQLKTYLFRDAYHESRFCGTPLQKSAFVNAVASVLELADRFGMLVIVEHCEELLMKCELYSEPCLTQRLVLATKFSLNGLQKRCLELCKTVKVIKEVMESPFYKDLSFEGKTMLLERGMELR